MLNSLVIQGRLTAQPELKSTNSGVSVVSFSVACERDYASNGNRETDFINCVAWRKTAEFVNQYFNKGDMLLVSGRLEMRKYESNGQTRTVYELNVSNVNFCGSKSESAQNARKALFDTADTMGTEIDDDVPFD